MVAQKRHLFELTQDEAETNNSVVAWALKLPAPAKTGNEYHDDDMRMKRDAFVKLIDKLWRNLHIVTQAADRIENRAKSQSSRDTTRFFESVSQLRNLDGTWACNYLSSSCKLSMQMLETAGAADPDPTLKIPKECREKEVLDRALQERMTECKNRLELFNESNLLGKHGINWARNGVYEVVFDEKGKAKSILHRPTGDHGKVPEHVMISQKFELDQNWSDYFATVGLKPTTYVIAEDFFDGPHKIKLMSGTSKDFDQLEKNIKANLTKDELEKEKRHSAPAKAFRSEAKAAACRENMMKARQKLQEKRLALNNKRKIKLVSS